MFTEEQRAVLSEACKNHFFKVYAEAVNTLYVMECAKLPTCPPEQLLRVQGVLQGIAMCRNIAMFGNVEGKEEPRKTTVVLPTFAAIKKNS